MARGHRRPRDRPVVPVRHAVGAAPPDPGRRRRAPRPAPHRDVPARQRRRAAELRALVRVRAGRRAVGVRRRRLRPRRDARTAASSRSRSPARCDWASRAGRSTPGTGSPRASRRSSRSAGPTTPRPSTLDEVDVWRAETNRFWRGWIDRGRFPDHPWREHVQRSALTLKGLTYTPTGALLAAPTTSLPEHPGGQRNWDYRYAWVRDSAFTLWALHALGFESEADDFLAFLGDVLEPQDARQRARAAAPATSRSSTPSTARRTAERDRARPPLRLRGQPAGARRRTPQRARTSSTSSGAIVDCVFQHTKSRDSLSERAWRIVVQAVEAALELLAPERTTASGRAAARRCTTRSPRSCAGSRRTAVLGSPRCAARRERADALVGRRTRDPRRRLRARGARRRVASPSPTASDELDASLLLAPARFGSCPRATSACAPRCSPSPTSSPTVRSSTATAPTRGRRHRRRARGQLHGLLVLAGLGARRDRRGRPARDELREAHRRVELARPLRRGARSSDDAAPRELPPGAHPPGAHQRGAARDRGRPAGDAPRASARRARRAGGTRRAATTDPTRRHDPGADDGRVEPAPSTSKLVVVANRLPVHRRDRRAGARAPAGSPRRSARSCATATGVWVGWTGETVRDDAPTTFDGIRLEAGAPHRARVRGVLPGVLQRHALAALPRRGPRALVPPRVVARLRGGERAVRDARSRASRRSAARSGCTTTSCSSCPACCASCAPTCASDSSCTSRSRRVSCSCSCRGAASCSPACSGADVVGFQVPGAAIELLAARPPALGRARHVDGRSSSRVARVLVGAFPISVDAHELDRLAPAPRVRAAAAADPLGPRRPRVRPARRRPARLHQGHRPADPRGRRAVRRRHADPARTRHGPSRGPEPRGRRPLRGRAPPPRAGGERGQRRARRWSATPRCTTSTSRCRSTSSSRCTSRPTSCSSRRSATG